MQIWQLFIGLRHPVTILVTVFTNPTKLTKDLFIFPSLNAKRFGLIVFITSVSCMQQMSIPFVLISCVTHSLLFIRECQKNWVPLLLCFFLEGKKVASLLMAGCCQNSQTFITKALIKICVF